VPNLPSWAVDFTLDERLVLERGALGIQQNDKGYAISRETTTGCLALQAAVFDKVSAINHEYGFRSCDLSF
jgi:hypothetical protein